MGAPTPSPLTGEGWGEGDSPSAARHRVARLCRGGFETRPPPVRRGKPGNPTVVGTKIAARRPIRHSGARRIPAPQEPSPIQSPAAAVSSRWRWRSYFILWCAGRNRHGWFPRRACPVLDTGREPIPGEALPPLQQRERAEPALSLALLSLSKRRRACPVLDTGGEGDFRPLLPRRAPMGKR